MDNNEIEELPGCMCEYIPEDLREQIETVAEKYEAYASQVVTVALKIGLGVVIGKTPELLQAVSREKRGPIKQRKRGKLTGAGV
jgi:hypothetical protein